MKYIYLAFGIIFSLSSIDCSNSKLITNDNQVYVYNCNQIKLIYSPLDSAKYIIYLNSFNSENEGDNKGDLYAPLYQDSAIVKLFEQGIITSKTLLHSRSIDGWYNFTNSNRVVKNIIADDCIDIISDSNKTIVELITTSRKQKENGEVAFPFEVVYSYGTVHYCFELKFLEDNNYAIKFTGVII